MSDTQKQEPTELQGNHKDLTSVFNTPVRVQINRTANGKLLKKFLVLLFNQLKNLHSGFGGKSGFEFNRHPDAWDSMP